MWLARQLKPSPAAPGADLGVTSIQGSRAGVLTRGEVRDLPVYGPGGYAWLPENGAEVLVIQGGPGGEEQCVAGTRLTAEALEPGEVRLSGPVGSFVHLRRDGGIELRGTSVTVTGGLTVAGGLTVTEGLTVAEGLTVTGGLAVSGSLTVNGRPYVPPADAD